MKGRPSNACSPSWRFLVMLLHEQDEFFRAQRMPKFPQERVGRWTLITFHSQQPPIDPLVATISMKPCFISDLKRSVNPHPFAKAIQVAQRSIANTKGLSIAYFGKASMVHYLLDDEGIGHDRHESRLRREREMERIQVNHVQEQRNWMRTASDDSESGEITSKSAARGSDMT